MEDKYLPIGTVCTLKNNNKKIMIISYFALEYNGNIKMYDYKGCVYPEGLLLPAQNVSFNHEDIENIEYLGLKNEQYEAFNRVLNRKEEINEKQYEQKTVMSNFKFDENGVVIFDGSVQDEPEVLVPGSVTQEISNSNPFIVESNYLSEEVDISKKADIFKFDENGVVISDDSVSDNPVAVSKYQFDENGFVIAELGSNDDITPEVPNTVSSYQFDANGIVITDGISTLETNSTDISNNNTSNVSNYKFDKDGVVIEDHSEDSTISSTPILTSDIKFDKNGMVIADGISTLDANSTDISTSNISNASNYKFDENGVVISE